MASGCSVSDYHGPGAGSGSSSQKFEEVRLKHGARGEDRATASVCKKITDSVYELYTPPTSNVEMEILFFHGLHMEKSVVPHLSTWRSRCTEGSVWPKHWLPADYPAARVLTIAYDASLEKDDKHGRMDLYLVTESLLQDLLLANVGQTRPVVLVGHSIGGLVIKELCLSAHKTMSLLPEATQRMLTFLQNIRGIFYYGTPHQGIKFPYFLEKLQKKGELVGIMRVLNKDLARLNQDFQRLCGRYNWHIAGVSETQASDLGGGLLQVFVEEASSRCEGIIPVLEDHFSICRPSTKESNTYQYFVRLIWEVQLKVSKEIRSMSIPGDFQILPRIQVGALSSSGREEIEKNLEMFSAVGLWGMGGIGKTTLSKAAFNSLHIRFEYTLFVENVKLILGDAKEYRNKVLKQMHHKGKELEKIPDRATLGGKDLLVVLDDVETDRDIGLVDELQAICSPNSRFILTSRDREILNKVDRISIMEVNGLERKEAETLFKSYAIPYYGPLLPWQPQCLKDIVEKCQGLPLILEVVGKYLNTSGEESVWKQTLNTLRAADDVKAIGVGAVWSKLRVSYDSLRDEEKQMFIEASTFFQGRMFRDYQDVKWTLRQAKVAWNAAYTNEAIYWKTLVDRSLVYDVAEDANIEMHEHLRSFGEMLAKDMSENKKIRVTIKDPGCFYLHNRNHELEKVHTIQVVDKIWNTSCLICKLLRRSFYNGHDVCVHSFPRISVVKLQAMRNLHYLQLDKCTLVGRTLLLPRNLIIFHSEGLGQNISFTSCSKLVYLTMKASGIKRLPDSFRNLSNLQFLYLKSADLKWLPEFFGSLHKLHTCRLQCDSLTELPFSVGSLVNLQKLFIHSDKLGRLPESFGDLRNLQELKIESGKLERLPESFGGLGNLQELSIYSGNLKRLPESFGRLGNLQMLYIESDKLNRLSESFGALGNLQKLYIWRSNIERLSEFFGGLGNLQELEIESGKLKSLPESFGGLGNLQKLKIESGKLERLPKSFGGLGNLQELEIKGCKLERLPESFGGLGNLQKLEIEGDKLERLPESFGGLGNLQKLCIWRSNLERLPESFGSLGNLQVLYVVSDNLKTLPESFGSLGNLQELNIVSDNLKTLPESFGGLGNLQNLNICRSSLERLPESFGGLGKLQKLYIMSGKLERLLEPFGGLGDLRDFSFAEKRLYNFRNLLCLDGSTKLERMSEYFRVGNLRKLKVRRSNLERFLESFEGLGNLQELYICRNIPRGLEAWEIRMSLILRSVELTFIIYLLFVFLCRVLILISSFRLGMEPLTDIR